MGDGRYGVFEIEKTFKEQKMRRIVAIALVSFGISGCGYNTIQTNDEAAAAAKQQISVQLQRRADLIGNLVETVKGQAKQELEVFTQVARARAGITSAIQSGDAGEMANANDQLTAAVRGLNIQVEAYPQIKSDQAFLRLQDELAGTENRIAVSRTDYNEAAQKHNTYIRRFPQVITAKIIGAKPREYFEVTNAANREAPKVDFKK
jgi:LemA protein